MKHMFLRRVFSTTYSAGKRRSTYSNNSHVISIFENHIKCADMTSANTKQPMNRQFECALMIVSQPISVAVVESVAASKNKQAQRQPCFGFVPFVT